MSLLEEIQNDAISSASDLGALLRKCKLLAARLGSQPLEEWLVWESNGYPNEIEVPDYRIWSLKVRGNFSGPFGSGITNADIPLSCLSQEARENYRNYKCRQSIASLEQLLQGSEQSVLRVNTGDLALALGENVFENQNCLQAWAEISVSHIYELFNNVRNRILDFSLAVWKEDPTAGESKTGTREILEASRVTQIFNTTVYGGSTNLLGNAENSKITFSVHQGDIHSLEKTLRENSIPQEEIDGLKNAISEDGQPVENGKFGPKVSNWVSSIVKKAAKGSWDVGAKIIANILTQIISKYYGF